MIMTPIINPWLFYIASIADKLYWILIIAMGVSAFICVCAWLCDLECEDNELKREMRNAFKVFMIVSIAFTFLPSKKTCYQMMISAQVTEENVDKAEDIIRKSIDYISEKINKK